MNQQKGKFMKKGDLVEATWYDGLVLTGSYTGTERGYVILKSRNGDKIVCDTNAVKFKIVNKKL